MNPRISINLGKLRHNATALLEATRNQGIQLVGVTKGACGSAEIVQTWIDAGIDHLADSRIENLMKLSHFKVRKTLLRLPMLSQVQQVVAYADYSLNSELATILALDQAAGRAGKRHGVILMIDLGDLREGQFYGQDLRPFLEPLKQLKFVYVAGVGTNLTCFGGVLPDETNLNHLMAAAAQIETVLGQGLEIVSGGNSSSIPMLLNHTLPDRINQLRLGEALLLGTESAYGKPIPFAKQHAFQLTAEIVEVQTKPSLPVGTIGRDVFGNVPHFEDQGLMKRAIIAVGKQDTATHAIYPVDPGIEVLGGSSDHLILNITRAEKDYRVGDEVDFHLSYGAMLALMTSEYVHKIYI